MTILHVREIWNGRQASIDSKNVRNYRRTFRVETDSMLDGPFQVTNTALLPSLFAYYADPAGGIDLGALVHKITPRQLDEPFFWEVDVDYSSKIDNPEQAQTGAQEQDPLRRPSKIKWSMAKYQKAIDKDRNDKAMTNSAGEKYLVEIDDSRPVLTISRNEQTVLPAQILEYQDAISSDTFFGAAAGTAKMDSISAESAYENGTFYWQVEYVIHFRREGWKLKLLDEGMQELVGGKLRPIYPDNSANPVTAPVPLDSHGVALTLPITPSNPAKFNEFDVYKDKAFAPLNLP